MSAVVDPAVSRWAQAHARTVVRVVERVGPGQEAVAGPDTIRDWHVALGPVRCLAAITRLEADSPITTEPPRRRELLLAAGGENGIIEILVGGADGGPPPLIWPTIKTKAAVRALSWAAADDEPLLVISSDVGEVSMWDWRGVSRLAGYIGVAVAREGTPASEEQPPLAIGGPDGSVRISDGRSGLAPPLAVHPGGVTSIAWAQLADGSSVLATGGGDETVRIWDGSSGTQLLMLPGSAEVVSLALLPLPGGQILLASVEGRGAVYLWDARTGKQVWNLPGTGTGGQVCCVAATIMQEGPPLLFLGYADGRIRVAELRAGPAEHATSTPPGTNKTTVPGTDRQAGPTEEIVPAGWTEPLETATTAVAWAGSPGGQPLLATGHDDGAVRIWDVNTGDLARIISLGASTTAGRAGAVRSVAWAVLPDGRPLLATGHEDGSTVIRDGLTGDRQITIPVGDGRNVRALAWAVLPGGGLQLATADADGKTRVLSGHAGTIRWSVSDAPAWSVAWAVLPDGQLLLATGNTDGCARIYDGHTGSLLHTLSDEDAAAEVNSVAWAVRKSGQLLLAVGSDDGKVRVWDGNTWALLRTLTEPSGPVFSVAWTVLPDDTPLLATTGKFDERSTAIWDGHTFERLASLPGARGTGASLAWAQPGDGRLLLCTTPGMSELPARIWKVRVTSAEMTGPPAVDTTVLLRSLGPIGAGLLALGRVDLWPPLGLIDDLVTLTGPGPADQLKLNDGRLRPLAQHAGIGRLCELDWPVPARISFAGLLASGLFLAPAFRPPPGPTASSLRDALARALTEVSQLQRADSLRVAEVDLGGLSAAADMVTDRMATMLAILGPQAVAADPALPLLMAQSAAQLPVLAGHQLRMLAEFTRPGSTRPRESDGGLRHAPGTAGVGRRGSLTQLLPTQLALPPDLLTIRYVQGHLLYRRHVARVPPTPEPVTLILDTTPPTFGSAENALRLVAHLITTVLWEHGEHPVLISLAEPTVATPLTSRAHLARLWTTRSLNRPGPAILTALDVASESGSGLVLLTHHHTPERYYLPGLSRRLVTTHHSAEQAPPMPSGPNHFHLPPDPTQAMLAAVVWAVLTPRGRK